MPIPLLYVGAGLVAGFFVGSKTTNLLKIALLGGGGYVAYQAYKGA
ncbi:hypothetical protein ABMX69_06855 [Vibrio vulnificus]|nr:hypothetical protein [Vibrio vulnificus]EHT4939539.1 hypothetical protein [Vibrio vulnificus]